MKPMDYRKKKSPLLKKMLKYKRIVEDPENI